MLYATSCKETEQHNFPFLYQISFSRFGPGLLFPWGSFAWEVESRAYQGMPSWGNFFYCILWTEIIWLQNTSGQSKNFDLALNKATPSVSYVFFSIYPPSFAKIYLPYLWFFPRVSLTRYLICSNAFKKQGWVLIIQGVAVDGSSQKWGRKKIRLGGSPLTKMVLQGVFSCPGQLNRWPCH